MPANVKIKYIQALEKCDTALRQVSGLETKVAIQENTLKEQEIEIDRLRTEIKELKLKLAAAKTLTAVDPRMTVLKAKAEAPAKTVPPARR